MSQPWNAWIRSIANYQENNAGCSSTLGFAADRVTGNNAGSQHVQEYCTRNLHAKHIEVPCERILQKRCKTVTTWKQWTRFSRVLPASFTDYLLQVNDVRSETITEKVFQCKKNNVTMDWTNCIRFLLNARIKNEDCTVSIKQFTRLHPFMKWLNHSSGWPKKRYWFWPTQIIKFNFTSTVQQLTVCL